jgi:general secretion pathway protein L
LSELSSLIPPQFVQWLVGSHRKSLLLVPAPETIALRLLGGNKEQLASKTFGSAEYTAAAIDQFLQEHGLERNQVAIGIRFPANDFFARKLTLPIETSRSLDEIVVRDLTLKTPFRLADIYHGHVADRTAGPGKIAVRQWVIRRELVEDAVEQLGLELDGVNFIDSGPADDQGNIPFIALRQEQADRSWIRIMALGLLLATIASGSLAAGTRYWRQEQTIERLDAELAIARSKAQQVRAELDKLEQKQAMLMRLRSAKTNRPALLELWEEVTKLLPSHSWLTELRLSEEPGKGEQELALAGFSAAAANLVTLLGQSTLFTDARLTAPIVIDPVEGKERFALQVRIKQLDRNKGAP